MLAINTAFLTANLALESSSGVFTKTLDAKSKHSENVLKNIDELCKEANIDILDVDTVAVVTGPGSFTGLRIGVAIAKALGCVNKNLKFVSVSSLELMAYIVAKNRLNQGQDFVCVLNALSNFYFVGYFDKNGTKLKSETMVEKEVYDQITVQKFGLAGDLEGLQTVEISSLDLLKFAKTKHEFISEKELLPLYLRPSQAESDLLLKNTKKDTKNS